MRKSLSEILRNGDQGRLRDAWDQAKAAEDFAPLPSGDYVCRLVAADLFNARQNGTPGVKFAFKVLEGEHAGRQVWLDCWLTAPAMPQTKRDLGKLGITRLEQLETPLPPGIRCRVKVALRKDDDGTEYNRVRRFEVVAIDEPERDAYSPIGEPPSGNGRPTAPGPAETFAPGDAAEPPRDVPVDTSFDPAAFAPGSPHPNPLPQAGEGTKSYSKGCSP